MLSVLNSGKPQVAVGTRLFLTNILNSYITFSGSVSFLFHHVQNGVEHLHVKHFLGLHFYALVVASEPKTGNWPITNLTGWLEDAISRLPPT